MAGSTAPEPKPDLGWKATVAGLIFSATILAGFGVATASNYEDNFKKDAYETDSYDDTDAYEEGEYETEESDDYEG